MKNQKMHFIHCFYIFVLYIMMFLPQLFLFKRKIDLMAQIKLTVPVLIQNVKSDGQLLYLVKPVFFQQPQVSDRSLETALQQFRQQLRKSLSSIQIDRTNFEKLFWYKFNPKIQHKVIPLQFYIGKKQYVAAKFSVISFCLGTEYFITLSGFSSHTFMTGNSELKGKALQDKVIIEICQLVKSYKKQYDCELWDMEQHQTARAEFASELELTIEVEHKGFNFEDENKIDFYRLINKQKDFNGADELDKVAVDLGNRYPSGLKRAFYRENELAKIKPLIYNADKSSFVIIGPEGIGRHSLIEELHYRYLLENYKNDADERAMKKIWMLDPLRIISGMTVVGMWQKRLSKILDYVEKRLQKFNSDLCDSILIDNPLALLRIGKSAQNSLSVSDLIKPYIEASSLQFILLSTAEEWNLISEQNRRFADLFQQIPIKQTSEEDAMKMILQLRKKLEFDFNCIIELQTIKTIFEHQRSYSGYQVLPGSVAKLLILLAKKYSNTAITADIANMEYAQYSGLNSILLDEINTFENEEIEETIKTALVGQDSAVAKISDLIHQIKAKLQNKNKPLATLLFVGPTGVGKTEAAKVLCRYLLGDEQKLIRFDMNEYPDAYSINRLLGDYHQAEGLLASSVRNKPFGVLLFDEIEKADQKVQDLLLQVLDEGLFTNALGVKIHLKNYVIIMTSNVGSSEIAHRIGFENENSSDEQIYRNAIEKNFRPEFVNRIEDIVIFDSLKLEDILEIARIQIGYLFRREGFTRRTTILNISQEVLHWVARRGFDSKMGARALKRQIEKDLTLFSAEELIKSSGTAPVLFNIELKDGQLQSKLETLNVLDSNAALQIPTLPASLQIRQAYEALIVKLEKIEQLVENEHFYDEGYFERNKSKANLNAADWRFYQLKQALKEKKDKFEFLCSDFKNIIEHQLLSVSNLKLKKAPFHHLETNTKFFEPEHLFEQNYLDEISDLFKNSADEYSREEAFYLNDFTDLAFLNMSAQAATSNETDKIEIHVSSLLQKGGELFCDYLIDLYSSFLESLDISYKVSDYRIETEGYALFDLLKNERGYHLFYPPHQMPNPVRVLVYRAGEQLYAESLKSYVTRIYDLRKGDQSGVLTDLNSKITTNYPLDLLEFKILLFCALDKADREFL